MGSSNIFKSTSTIFPLKNFRECWKSNPGYLSPEASTLTIVLCCPPPPAPPQDYLLWLEPMPKDMLQDYEEVVQRDVVRVKLPPELEARFDHLLDDQLEDVDQVALLYQDRVAI